MLMGEKAYETQGTNEYEARLSTCKYGGYDCP
jgi:hypothetical protein